jgi:toxin CptA
LLPPAFVVGVLIARNIGAAWRAAPMAFGVSGVSLDLLVAALVVFVGWRIGTAVQGMGRFPEGVIARLAAPNWPPALAMAIIAIANIGLLLLVANWPYTTVLVDVATGQGMQNLLRAALVLIFFGGAVLGAISAGGFEIRGASLGEISSRTMGGMLMGVGAAMIPGGNDALVLIGLPLLQAPAFAAYAAMIAAIAVCFGTSKAFRPKRSGR